MFRLKKEDSYSLVRRPETGMGYQLVRATINQKPPAAYVVLNCELVIGIHEILEEDGLPYKPADELLEDATGAFAFDIKDELSVADLEPPFGGGPETVFSPAPRIRRTTLPYEGFARLSAFPNDKRILPGGELADDTYATTVEDLKMVPSGFAAAGRYALINAAAAVYVYMIVPGKPCPIDGGTVRPANNQAGGGVEVLFPDGAPKGSAFKPYRIPEL